MSVYKRLASMVENMPPGSSVTLPVDWLRELLETEGEGENPDTLLTLGDLAGRMNRAPGTVRTWCNQGLLPGSFKLRNRSWRIPAGALQDFLKGEQKGENRWKGTRGHRDGDLASWRRVRGFDAEKKRGPAA
jgi:hypothetical protein